MAKNLLHCEIGFGIYRSAQLTPHPFFLLLHLFSDHTLVDRGPLPPLSPPIGNTSLTHVMRFPAYLTTSPTPTAMGQSFIITLYEGISFIEFYLKFILVKLKSKISTI
jgi:hypothetical protein